ncbi:MAG: polyribonucleotide nucleotidyltransferase [Candidatus Omnitrophica bacterium]|nr:polyribonucleotide nucleotidyltransferase [Candidatus Omnitrophota bacterium]
MEKQFEVLLGNKAITIKTGKLAKLADGAVWVQQGGTVVLVTAVCSREIKEGTDFFPLTVDYREKTYAAGKIPGGFFKREGRPTEKEILSARLIDRPIRPLFPDGFRNELQIMASVLSSDSEYDADVLAVLGASCALMVSDIPFEYPIAACRIGRLDGTFVCNPTFQELEKSDLNVVVAANREGVVMIEATLSEVSEEDLYEAIQFGFAAVQPLVTLQTRIAEETGRKKRCIDIGAVNTEIVAEIKPHSEKIKALQFLPNREDRQKARQEVLDILKEKYKTAETPEELIGEDDIMQAYYHIEKAVVRDIMLKEKKRVDGREFTAVRPITCEVGVLPRTHGSGLFTRGETQSLCVTTLGTSSDEQQVEALEGGSFKSFMLHYNFPPFSVGEARPVRGPGRREIGHGALAEKSLKRVTPPKEAFPYTIRLVSDILESNGSSSMATVCAGSLALMDAGVPISAAVAGIAMGLVWEGDRWVVLTDIAGAEDHYGDMDFKVAGTRKGLTAMQLDIKITHLTGDIISTAFHQAKKARLEILDRMDAVIEKPRADLSVYAPRIIKITINPEKIRDLIGPGGKMIKSIIQRTGATIDIEDDGTVFVGSPDEAAVRLALELIDEVTAEAEVGKTYKAKVKKIMAFGAFCEILPGTEGLVHVSELSDKYVKNVDDVVSVGDEIMVKVIGIDDQGRINLSKKQADQNT